MIYTKIGGERKFYIFDVVYLVFAISLCEIFRVFLKVFHMFDNGKTRGVEGFGMSLLMFEIWCEKCADDLLACKVIEMIRSHSIHLNKKLNL